MPLLKALLGILALATLSACSSNFRPTQSSQAYQDYMTDTHLSPDDSYSYDRGW